MTDLIPLPAPGVGNTIFAKLEYQNPTGSHYDRVYPPLLDELEARGKIVRGVSTLVETTSGNAGIAFGAICQERGYPCKIFVPTSLPESRINLIRQTGASVVKTPADKYIAGAAAAMREFLLAHLEKTDGVRNFYSPNHSQSLISCTALESIADEAIVQSGGAFDCFVGAAGNGSTLKGIGVALKRANPLTHIIAFDPEEAPVATAIKSGKSLDFPRLHTMYGAGAWGVKFPHLQDAIVNLVDDIKITRKSDWGIVCFILCTLGYLVGETSIAAYHLATEYCRERSGQKVLIVFYEQLIGR